MFEIHTIVSAPFAENTYVLWRPSRDAKNSEGDKSTPALVIDPGLQPELILEFLRDQGLSVAAILNTHGHADHIGGNEAMKGAFPHAPLMIGAGDEPMLANADLNLSGAFGFPVTSPPADRLLKEGDTVELANIQLEVREIPGHSPGHIVYIIRGEPIIVFGGDVLFREGIGRTDFPGGSFDQLAAGIRAKMYALPDDAIIYPGHGPVTKIGFEKRNNPFVSEV